MNPSFIFWPAIAQAALTFAVAARMYFVRVAEMRARRVHPQSLATTRGAAMHLENVAAADNFRNLFEVPVLFFAICPALYVTRSVTPLQLVLAWTFVALRLAHSFIHVTYNRVMHRFAVFVLATTCVFAMWAIFAVELLRGK
ncbi:conserved membrane hypothetical protein [Burkholderiales bacterium]|nr:conserved membrane hypothetical protein [Burkholderiales bacterium]